MRRNASRKEKGPPPTPASPTARRTTSGSHADPARGEFRPRAAGLRWALVAVAALGLAGSWLIARNLQTREAALFEVEFARRAEERAHAIESQVVSELEHVRSVAALYYASGSISRQRLHAFASVIFEEDSASSGSAARAHTGLLGLGFNPVVLHAQRREHEAELRSQGLPEYHITEQAPSGRLIPAADREMYVPVAFLEPQEGNETAFGYDVASESSRRAALDRARDTGEAVITGRLQLVQEPEEQFGVLIFVPVFAGSPPATLVERRARLHGYAVGVLPIANAVDAALVDLRPTGIHLRLTDDSADEDGGLLYDHRSRTLLRPSKNDEASRPDSSETTQPARAAGGGAGRSLKRHSFEIGGRTWEVAATPTPAFEQSRSSWVPAVTLGTGLLVTLLLISYLFWQSVYNRRMLQAVVGREKAELRQADFGRVLDESHDEIYVFDAETLRFLHVNRGARRHLGYTMDELRNMTPLDLKVEMLPEAFETSLRPLRHGTKAKIEFTTIHRCKDGTKYDVEVHLQLSSFDGVPAFVAVILDITERKQLDERMQQTQRVEALGTMAGGIAHDINNLLTAIMGHTELGLLGAPEGGTVHGHLREVMAASERARGVVRRILAFSRRNPVERRPVDLSDVVREALGLMRVSFPKNIAIHEDLTGHGVVVGDPTEIHQVVMNIGTNAAYAMRGRGGTFSVRLGEASFEGDEATRLGVEPGRYLHLALSDTGDGISPDDLRRVFDPFFSTKKRGEGTGMGLAVAQGIVKNHGGALNVTSALNRGTTFEVLLPRAEAEADVVQQRPLPVRGEESILLVDDEAEVLEPLKNMLETSGYRVEPYSEGSRALDALRRHPEAFDLVITDYAMPSITGTRLALEASRIAPRVPVILVSGYGELLDRGEVRDSGVRVVLSKPVRHHELVTAVREAIDRPEVVSGETARAPAGPPPQRPKE